MILLQVVVMPTSKEGKGSLRVIHRDQLQVIRPGGNPRVPDCYQRTPKRVPLGEAAHNILALGVDGRGIHAIVRSSPSRLTYAVYRWGGGGD